MTNSNLLIDGRVAFGAFDFDGNILAPDTITYVIDRETGEEVGIPAHTLDQNPELMQSKYRWKDDIIDSLIHFRDYHTDAKHLGPDQFKADIEEALRRNAYAQVCENSKMFSGFLLGFLLSSRLGDMAPDNMARIMWILSEELLTADEKEEQQKNIQSLYENYTGDKKVLTRDQALRFYLEEMVSYYPVSNPHIAKYLGFGADMSSSIRKVEAMKHAIETIRARILPRFGEENSPLAIGFSDDSVGNTRTMIEYFESARDNGALSDADTIHIYFTGKQSETKKLEKLGRSLEQSEDMTIIRI